MDKHSTELSCRELHCRDLACIVCGTGIKRERTKRPHLNFVNLKSKGAGVWYSSCSVERYFKFKGCTLSNTQHHSQIHFLIIPALCYTTRHKLRMFIRVPLVIRKSGRRYKTPLLCLFCTAERSKQLI